MLDQNADKSLQATVDGPVDHDGAVALAVDAHVFQLKPFGHLEVKLQRAALPASADGIHQMEVDFRPVEGTVAFVDLVLAAVAFQRTPKGLGGNVPLLHFAHEILGSCGKLHPVRKAEHLVNAVNEPNDV